MVAKKNIGSYLDDFLKEEGTLDELTVIATKEVLAWQVAQSMKEAGVSKVQMATRMKTSRSQVDRLLDPKDGNVTFATMQKAARALGGTLRVGFEVTHPVKAASKAKRSVKVSYKPVSKPPKAVRRAASHARVVTHTSARKSG